jgi:hypothetical protein
MNIFEMFDERKPGYESEKDDNSTAKLSDLRKTRLTLAHLNKLRMANDVRKFEYEKKMETIQKQYAAPAEEGAAPAGM